VLADGRVYAYQVSLQALTANERTSR
jgi:hypothetical protein